MRSFLLFVSVLGLGLAGCGKVSGPLKLYFIGSARFTTGGRTLSQPDTLATRLYASLDTSNASTLQRFTATVTYTPLREPFAYPVAPNYFNYLSLANTSQTITYLDTTLAPGRRQLLYTQVFSTRTTSGSERWEFVATDGNGVSSARSFTLAVRRPDSAAVFHDYLLKLDVTTTGAAARRFVQLKSGLALPGSAVLNPDHPEQQALTDLVVLPGGTRFAAPADASVKLRAPRWMGVPRKTSFILTALTDSAFNITKDAKGIQDRFTGSTTTASGVLAAKQVYAFKTDEPQPTYGLLRVLSLPTGTVSGLQLQVRLAKLPR